MAQRIFISYRRADTAGFARALHDRLRRLLPGRRFYFDVESITAGEDFARSIQDAIEDSATVLVVIGPDWLEEDADGRRRIDDPEDLVRVEVRSALEGGRRVIPVLVGDARLPDAEELPEDLAGLLALNAVEVSNATFSDATGRLAAMLRDPADRRRGLVAGGVAAAAALSAGLLITVVTPGAVYYAALGALAMTASAFAWVSLRATGVRMPGSLESAIPYVVFAALVGAGLTLHSEARSGTPFSLTVRLTVDGRVPDPAPTGQIRLDTRVGSRTENIESDGEAVFTGLPAFLAGGPALVRVEARGYEVERRDDLILQPNETIQVALVVEEVETLVRGTVLDPERVPVEAAVVDFGSGTAVDTTDAGGNFTVTFPDRPGTVVSLRVTRDGVTGYHDPVTIPGSDALTVIFRSPP